MKNPVITLVLAIFSLSHFSCSNLTEPPKIGEEQKGVPDDWFYMQRAYPNGTINQSIYLNALKEKKALEKIESRNNTPWEFEGPTNIGGRITDVEMHPSSMDIIYAGTASGGIFKSEDRGENWSPIFDDALSLSIGDMAIAPSDPNVLYVGTGESNGGGGSLAYDGVGMYKSIDGGDNWTHIGLDSTGSVGKVLVHPENPDIVWVAAMGPLFENNSSRGVYRSTDGGQAWEQVLYVSDSTGAIDLAMHPDQPNILYAAMWERVRRPEYRQYGGTTSGVYRSIDGGQIWGELTTDLPAEDKGRIGLAVDPSTPGRVYAMYTDEIGFHKNIFKSNDIGASWTTINSDSLSIDNISYNWWFSRLFVHPTDPETIFAFGLYTYRTKNGGEKWDNVNNNDSVDVHVDPHALYIHPQNPNFVVLGNDGGIYISEDGGTTWEHKKNMPITQFYTCEIDPNNPESLYGGAQDNGTVRTLSGGEDDWEQIFGGDGMVVRIDPSNSNTIYAATQYGFLVKSIDGGLTFGYTWLNINIFPVRRNWKTPYVLDPNNSQRIFYGSHRVHRSINGGSSWTIISLDLTGNPPPQTNQFFYGTITSMAISDVDSDIIYVGTDNGRVWNTTEGGGITNWNLLSQNLPDRWVTAVATHPTETETAYVTFSGYRELDYLPHVFKTNDSGNNWIDISGNLPEVPVNDIVIDPDHPEVLYVATDIGVYFSVDDGGNWELLGTGLPDVVVSDLCLYQPTRSLLAATYGRSMYSIALDEVILDAEEAISIDQLKIFPNPAKDFSRISFHLPEPAPTQVLLFNNQGQLIRQVFSGQLISGSHEFEIDLNGLPAGIYVCQVKTGKKGRSEALIKG